MSKIFQNIKESEFVYETKRFKFYFSSLFYLNKFKDEIEAFTEKMNLKFQNLYLMPVDLNDYSMFVLYSKIEKRGFYVLVDNQEEITWLGKVRLDGVIRMREN